MNWVFVNVLTRTCKKNNYSLLVAVTDVDLCEINVQTKLIIYFYF